jgi:hypothetical protein
MGKVRVVIRVGVGRDVRKSMTIKRSLGFAPMSL